MKIYTIIYEEEISSQLSRGFDGRLDNTHCENYSSLYTAKNRLKELFEEVKSQEYFKDIDFERLERDDDYLDELGIDYDDSIDKYGTCYISDGDKYEYFFIANIVKNELS